MVVGTVFNTACLFPIMFMNEARMLEKASRRGHYQRYQDATSLLIPMPVRSQ
jgi:hypothetical protein